MPNPKVSIVIPVYNGADYLAEAVDSALAQTYPDCEVVVVNDGSSDGGATRRVAQSYGGRIRYLEKANGGVATALNLGIERMTGDYFSWLSHDDVFLPDKVEAQLVCCAQQESPETTVVYSGYDLIDGQGRLLEPCGFESLLPVSRTSDPLYVFLHGGLHACAMLIPKRLFDRFGTFDVNLRTTQDSDFWLRLCRQRDVRFAYCARHVAKVRRHARQGSQGSSVYRRECTDFWLRVMDVLTPDEKVALSGSEAGFYAELAHVLEMSRMPEDVVSSARARARALNPFAYTPCLLSWRERDLIASKRRVSEAMRAFARAAESFLTR